jgi:hypothetical protein
VNCEQVPVLPASAVRRVLEDPRKIPYLMVWVSRWDGKTQEAARVAPYSEPGPCDWSGWIEIKHLNGGHTLVKTITRPMPRNGGTFLLMQCPLCQKLRRALYGWEPGGPYTHSARAVRWQCRESAQLRYSSEGGALLIRSRNHLLRVLALKYGRERCDRPEPWYPYVFTNPADAEALGVHVAS